MGRSLSLSIHLPLAAEKALQTEVGVQQSAIVLGNEEALSILVSNLVDNSINYTERDGRVLIRLRPAPTGAELTIEDSGPAIPVEEHERVFDRFYRRRDTVVTGNGLGLAIAKEIADRHGASIVLESSDALGGLSARVLFPPLQGGIARASPGVGAGCVNRAVFSGLRAARRI